MKFYDKQLNAVNVSQAPLQPTGHYHWQNLNCPFVITTMNRPIDLVHASIGSCDYMRNNNGKIQGGVKKGWSIYPTSPLEMDSKEWP